MTADHQREADIEMLRKTAEQTKRCLYCDDGLMPIDTHGRRCKKCISVASHLKYVKSKPAILARQKRNYEKNKKAIYADNVERRVETMKEMPLIMSFYQARSRSKKNGIPFTIKYSDLPQPPTHCPVFGIKLVYANGRNGTRNDNSPSLDKIIPALGYVPGNVDIISFRANWLKNNATIEEMKAIVNYMLSWKNSTALAP